MKKILIFVLFVFSFSSCCWYGCDNHQASHDISYVTVDIYADEITSLPGSVEITDLNLGLLFKDYDINYSSVSPDNKSKIIDGVLVIPERSHGIVIQPQSTNWFIESVIVDNGFVYKNTNDVYDYWYYYGTHGNTNSIIIETYDRIEIRKFTIRLAKIRDGYKYRNPSHGYGCTCWECM